MLDDHPAGFKPAGWFLLGNSISKVVETQHAASLCVGYIAGGSLLPIIGVHAED